MYYSQAKFLYLFSTFCFVILFCVALFTNILLEKINVAYIKIDVHLYPQSKVEERFLSLGLDTINVFDGLDRLNLTSPKLIDLTSRLSPAYLRFGGTMADRLIFVDGPFGHNYTFEEDTACQGNVCLNKFLPFFTMNAEDFLQISNFCDKTNIRLIFDLNVLLRKGEDWNPSNAIKLFQLVKSKNLDLDWQLGNEPNSFFHVFNTTVSPKQLAKDFKVLRKLLNDFFPKSLLVGPDSTRPQPNRRECVEYMKHFLEEGSDYVDAMAWHQYYLNGRTATIEEFWSPITMDLLQSQIDTMVEKTKHFQGMLKMWLTETSSAYGGGAPHLSNSYAAIPLWLDKLGLAARNGIQVVARQSLLGGNYSLIDDDHTPLPDYWIAVLYKRLVGAKVVSCSIMSPLTQRYYCHCASDKTNNVVIFGMNLDNIKSYIDFIGSAFTTVQKIDEYILTAPGGDRLSKNILLNGKLLEYKENFPLILPRVISPWVVEMPPYSFGFWKLYDVIIPYCASED